MFFRFPDRTYILAYEITDHNLRFEAFFEESLRTFSYPVRSLWCTEGSVTPDASWDTIVVTEVCLK